jgi:hypothetical protein
MSIRSIWIENEVAEPFPGGAHNPRNTNTDVLVTLENGTRWGATVFSYENISTLVEKNRNTGECLGGRYFWASNMLLLDLVTREEITQVVEHLLETGEFESIFARLRDS